MSLLLNKTHFNTDFEFTFPEIYSCLNIFGSAERNVSEILFDPAEFDST